jgi:hypothetical protein
MYDIKNCTLDDADTILSLYDAAMDLQTQKGMVVWPKFERPFLENEIREERQWKLLIDGNIACNWAITFNDKEIWFEKDNNNSIYIHRIATHPLYRGKRFIDVIVLWAKAYALQLEKDYVRLDTLGNNTKLIGHYTSAGFDFLGITRLRDTKNLPEHYHREPDCCRFELQAKR